MVSLLLLAAIAAQPAVSQPPARPAVKTCPDRSIILATEKCFVFPDHRYLMTHGAEVEMLTAEWWCRGDRRPSVAQFRIRLQQRRDTAGRSIGGYETVELASLKVKGKQPSASTVRLVRERLVSLNSIGSLSGRCLHRSGGTILSVLTMKGYQEGRREPISIELELS